MPGVDMDEALAKTAEIDHDLIVLSGEHHTEAEPVTADYADYPR